MIFENPIVPTFGEKTRDTHLFIFAYSHLMHVMGLFIFLWGFPAEYVEVLFGLSTST